MERWQVRLAEGDAGAAWSLFLERYRGLILATIRRTISDDALADEAFEHVCDALSDRELARLRRYDESGPRVARFSTWLVTVVHHQLVDWLRHRDGRSRIAPPPALTPLQQQIFTRVFAERRSHAEAYELVRGAAPRELPFSAFLKELAETYRLVELARPRGVMHYLPARAHGAEPPAHDPTQEQQLAIAQLRDRLANAMATLPDEERLALQLFVVEKLPAAEVARTLGWPGPKTVYNRAYRGLTRVRAALEIAGLERSDF